MDIKSNFESIRREIANKLHLVATILAIPVAIASGYRIFIMELQPHFILDILIAVILIISYYFRSKIDYNKLMLFLLGYVLILGTVTLITFGLFGFGFTTMFFSVVIVTTLYGIRYGLTATGLAVVITGIVILGVHFQWINFDSDFNSLSYSISHWLVQGIAFTCILLMTVLTHGAIYRRLEEVNMNLAESEARYNLALETVEEAVWELGLKNNKTFVSNKLFDVMNFAGKDMANNLESWKKQIHENDLAMVEDAINKHIQGSLTNIDIEYRIKDHSGGYQWISTRGKIVEWDNSGNPARVIGTHRDIGPRKSMENILKESEEKYRNLFMNANDAILLVSNEYIIDSNLSSADLFGFSREELIGRQIHQLCPAYQTGGGDSRSSLDTLFRGLIQNRSLKVEWEFKRSDEKVVETSMGLNVIAGFENMVFQLIITDISEHKRFEEAKLNAIVEAEERERLKLAGNLHDDVGPLLSSLNMYLSLLDRNQPGNKVDHVPEMQSILKDAISSIREISNNFSPHNLRHFGLIPALTPFIESFGNLIDIKFNQNIDNTRLPTLVEISCFRIIKELLNNSLKHARATIVTLDIFFEDKKLQIEYYDNGIGFDLEKTISSQQKGMGLLNILNRLTAIKANYDMKSIHGEGFKFKMNLIVN
jgi:PAS domain S-box-containing protein